MRQTHRSAAAAHYTRVFVTLVTAAALAGIGALMVALAFASLPAPPKPTHGAAVMVDPVKGRTLAVLPYRGA